MTQRVVRQIVSRGWGGRLDCSRSRHGQIRSEWFGRSQAPHLVGTVDRAAAGVGLPAPRVVTAAAGGTVDRLLSRLQSLPTARATRRCGVGRWLDGHEKQTVKNRGGAGPTYETTE